VDEYTRECLALEVERSMTALEVVDVIRQVVLIRGVPGHIRSDNGSEFIAQAIRSWLESAAISTLYIAPASPWENGYAESFFSRLRDELLNAELFADLREAKVLAAAWQNEYNHRRPHSSLDYLTPAAFAAKGAPSVTEASVRKHEEETLGALPLDPGQGQCPWTPASSPPVEEGQMKPEGANMVPTLIATGT
jgi:transposase InsO family protein